MYAQQGQWERAYEVAKASGPDVLAAFASRHAYALAGDGKSVQAAAVLANHGAQLAAAFFPTYVKIAVVRRLLQLFIRTFFEPVLPPRSSTLWFTRRMC